MGIKKLDWFNILKNVLLHLLFWVFIVTYFAWGFGLNENPKKSFINAMFFLPGHFIMVYPLLYFLVPKYLLPRKYTYFFIGLIILVLLCIVYTIMAQLSVSNVRSLKGATLTIGRNVLPFLHVAAIAVSIKLLKYWYFQKKQTIEAEQQRTIVELKLLKAQLHPHFLFNTLNNLYSHTLEASPKSPEIVMKLSGLLRFMIYDSNVPKIPLEKEIELLQNYIALEQMRYGERLDMSITINGSIKEYQIAPLLLLPFLENAFKHGTSKQIDQCWISLYISMEDSKMFFKLVNSIELDLNESSGKIGGMGLQNVKRRLDLLYNDKHHFKTIMLEEVFVVSLEVSLETLEQKFINQLE